MNHNKATTSGKMSSLLLRVRPRLLLRQLSSGILPARHQGAAPSAEKGHIEYERNWSRDPGLAKKYNPPQKGDLPTTFLLRRLGHAYEVYPLIVLSGAWFVLFCVTIYWSFNKMEIWLDRSHTKAPWDWERARDHYWKKSTVAGDFDGRTRKRVLLMEMLQDEMVEAAKKRGTR